MRNLKVETRLNITAGVLGVSEKEINKKIYERVSILQKKLGYESLKWWKRMQKLLHR